MKSDADLSQLFAALGHPWRIALLRRLLLHGIGGRLFGELAEDLGIPPSTLNHHLREMEAAGILHRQIEGRTTRFRLQLGTLSEAIRDLSQLCCRNENAAIATATIKE